MHVVTNGLVTLKYLHRKRGKEAIEFFGIIPFYIGTVDPRSLGSILIILPVQASGMRVASPSGSRLCLDSNGYRWARLMHKLLREICHAVNQSETGVLNEAECRRYRIGPSDARRKGIARNSSKKGGKRGPIAKSDAHNLHEALLKLEESVLRFMSDPDVSSPITRLSKKSGWQRSKSKSRGASGQNASPTPGAGYRVISIQWQNSDTIQSKPSRSHLMEMPLT